MTVTDPSPLTGRSAVWLRDNCACAECRDPGTGQKLFQITELPEALALASVRPSGPPSRLSSGGEGPAGWEVVWSPDGHRSHYDAAWLAATAEPDPRTEDGKELWADATALTGRLPETSWAAYTTDPAERLRMLDAVRSLGFCLLREVPLRDGQVREAARTFGFVRETNYGPQFEVRVEEQPNNLAFTNVGITPHTDNPYRDPVPTLQLLHCLVNDAVGGDSGLVDGFAVAARLRAQEPQAFAVLTGTPVEFAFRDATTELSAHRPLIELDANGRIREVRFNNRSLGTLRLPAARTDAFYAAYRVFAELLLAPEAQLEFRLGPGDCLVFDNTRLLHARTAFERGGARHLQGCYADLDALLSTVAVLRRQEEAGRSELPSELPSALPEAAHPALTPDQIVDAIADLFAGEGADDYLGEEVTQAQHMLQAAALAEAEGATPALVAAALLHDVGHFRGAIHGRELMAGTTDNRHSHQGADWLAPWFGPAVTEPVRLHVAAKRYLCAVEPAYFGKLSEASVHTLALQGGPMDPAEAEAFARLPHAADAVRLRRWDDAAKNVDAATPEFGHYRRLLVELAAAR